MADNTMTPIDNRRLLVSLAHPDDESFGMASTLVHYVKDGAEVHLIVTTNGDVGVVDEEFLEGRSGIAEVRLAELQCAADTLGLHEVYTFGYRDSGMVGTPDNDHPDCLWSADRQTLVERIVRIIRSYRPQVIITFDPFGGYGHPDHVRTHEATVEAFDAAGDETRYPDQLTDGLEPYSPQKLYFLTFTRKWLRLSIPIMRLMGTDPERLGRNQDINLKEIASYEYPIHASIRARQHKEIAKAAAECHASQLRGFGQPGLIQRLRRVLERSSDTYMRAYPPANGSTRERDLFEGVDLSR